MNLEVKSRSFSIAVVLLAAAATDCLAQTAEPRVLSALAAYQGADRERRLVAGAQAEGEVFWYTSFTGNAYKALARAFETKYPGAKVQIYRAANKELLAKIAAENQSKRHLADTVESTVALLKGLRENRMLVPYTTLYSAQYPAATKQSDGRGLFYWFLHRESYNGVGYNTTIVPPRLAPKNFADLLRPEFKGKIGFANGDTGARMIAAMLKAKGEQYIQRLRNQRYSLHAISARALADLVASGEVELSPTISREHAAEVRRNGGPIGWAPMELVPANAGGVAIVPNAPHPHAALLLADFILGPAGQKIYRDLDFASPTKDLGFKRLYPETGFTSLEYDAQLECWLKLLRDNGQK